MNKVVNKTINKDIKIHNRNETLLKGVSFGINKLIEATCNVIYDMPSSTVNAMQNEFLRKAYIGKHNSLDECFLIPNAIRDYGGEIPYFVLGTNLVKGWFVVPTILVGGVYLNRKEIYKSARIMPIKMEKHWNSGHDMLIWPEDGREKFGLIEKWRNSVIKAAIEYSKYGKVLIIPENLDSTNITDMPRMIKNDPNMSIDEYLTQKDEIRKYIKPFTLRAHHLPDWWKDLGNKYVSFGEPIEVKPSDEIQKLSTYSKEKCLQLVKILPDSVKAEAIMRNRGNFNERAIFKTVEQIIDELSPHSNKFREFKNAEDVMNNSRLTNHEKPRKYDMLRNYIAHYF